MINSKVYLKTKVSPFMVNYGRKLKIEADIRKKEKVEKIVEFTERIKKIQEEVMVALRKFQKEIKR